MERIGDKDWGRQVNHKCRTLQAMCCLCKRVGSTANPELIWEGKGAGNFVCVYIAEGQVGSNQIKEGKGVQRRGDTLSKEKCNF